MSKAEKDNCYLHIMITSDPYGISGHRFRGTFEDFSEIMQGDPIPFNNTFTRAGGFVGRQTINNDPYNRLFTWDFDQFCHSFITLPINMLSIQDEALASYNTGPSFAELVEPSMPLSYSLLDLNQVFKATWTIAMRHRELAAKADIYGPFYFKSHIENVWRKVPFLDMRSYVSHVEKFGVPVVQENKVFAPPGTDLRSFQTLAPSENYRGQTVDSSLEANDAVAMSMPIFEALGIPRDIFLKSSRELIDLSKFKFIAASESR